MALPLKEANALAPRSGETTATVCRESPFEGKTRVNATRFSLWIHRLFLCIEFDCCPHLNASGIGASDGTCCTAVGARENSKRLEKVSDCSSSWH